MADYLMVGKVWDTFQSADKEEISKLCKESSIDDDSEGIDLQGKDFRTVLYSLLWMVITGKITQEDLITNLHNALDQKPQGLSLLGDLLCAIDAETNCLEDKIQRENFLSLVSALSNTLPDALLKERLEPETLESAGIISSQKIFNQKLIRTKTKLFYKQQKFNLLREENEGYGKLITELGQELNSRINHRSVLENIKSLIGFFNLDPNRVLDIILEIFECRLDCQDFFLDLLKLYLSHCDTSGLCHILGFKYQFYHNSPDTKTPPALHTVTAILLKRGLLQLDDIYPHLLPKDAEIFENNKRKMLTANTDAKRLNVVLLTENESSDEKEKERNDQQDDMESDNQKTGLCYALLEIGAWYQAHEMMDRLPKFSLLEDVGIVKSLCYLVHCSISTLYARFSPKAALGKAYKEVEGCKRCVQFTDLPDTLFPMLFHLGHHLSTDPVLLMKVVRVSKGFMREYNQASEILKGKYLPVWSGVLTLLDEVLLPSLSLMECNCAVAEEIWGLLKNFPYEIRYRLYGQWKNESYNTHPMLVMAKARTIKKAKYITKRLTKENVKLFGRQIGKASHSSPGILFEHILNQIQRYDNFIGPMVDALKYLTPLAYDVLAFCVIEALANPDREKMKQSDTNISDWLQSLALFCGTVFKKYAIELTGLLQYVANQLKACKSLDLLVLKEVVQKMSGIELTEEITKAQLEALCGGDLLKAEGGYFGQVRNTKKSSQRLRDSLIEGKLTIPLCLLIAQQRNGIVFVEDNTRHLKLVGKIFDQCQDTLVQFGGFLATQLNTDGCQANLPSLDALHGTYHITPDVAFCLSRPLYRRAIQTRIEAFKKTEGQDRSKTAKQRQEALETHYCEVSDDVYRSLIESAIPLNIPKIWNNLSPQLYTTFWSLSMYDLYVPNERYEAEMVKLKYAIDGVDDNKELTSVTKKKKEKERCQLLIDKLKEEQHLQQEHNRCIRKWLETKKEGWFPSKTAKGETITQFLQLCIFPRCVFTANDAVYCTKFIHIIHTLQTPNFSTLICFDRIFSDISYIVASLTENEASRYGRFLCSMLEMVMRWHNDKKLYEQECGKYPGFLTVLRATNNEKADYLDFENFRHVCHKWQYKITKAVVVCLESKDYMQIRNTIMVLTKILPFYPKVQNLGQALERRIEKIVEEEKEKRQDLFTLATGYLGMLRLRKSSMIPENLFHIKEKDKASTNNVKQDKQEKQEKTENQASQSASRPANDRSAEESEKKTVVKKEKEDVTEKQSNGKETASNEKSVSQNSVEKIKPEPRSEDEARHSKTHSVKETAVSSRHDKGKGSAPVKAERSQKTKISSKVSKGHDDGGEETEKSRSASNEKEREREKEKEKDRAQDRSKDRDKERGNQDTSKERQNKKQRTHSPSSSDDSKKRKLDDRKFISPSSKEGTPVGRSDDSKKDKKERDKEKKNERKRTSIEISPDIKDAKRRKEEELQDKLSKKSEVSKKEKDKDRDKEREKEKEKDRRISKERSLDKDHDKSSRKDRSPSEHTRHSKERENKEDDSRTRKHRSAKPAGRDR